MVLSPPNTQSAILIKAVNPLRGHVSIILKADAQRRFLGSSHAARVGAGQFSRLISLPRYSGCFRGRSNCLLPGTFSPWRAGALRDAPIKL